MTLSILANLNPIPPEFERGAEESSILRQWRRGEHATQQTQESQFKGAIMAQYKL